jgi:hypothetical protein
LHFFAAEFYTSPPGPLAREREAGIIIVVHFYDFYFCFFENFAAPLPPLMWIEERL